MISFAFFGRQKERGVYFYATVFTCVHVRGGVNVLLFWLALDKYPEGVIIIDRVETFFYAAR